MIPVMIIGSGLVSSLGLGVAAQFQAVLAGKQGLRPLSRFPVDAYAQGLGGQLPDATEAALRQRFGEDEEPAWLMIRGAVTEVLGDDAGSHPLDPQLGLILGTNFGLMETLEWCWRERHDTGTLDEATFVRQQDVVTRVAELVGAGGPRAQLSLSCASGAATLELAQSWLREGTCTRVLAVAYDAITEFCWCGLSNLRTITSERLRPFDRRRQGTIFGEGAAALLLSTRPADAARATGWLLGAATNNNAFHLTAPAKDADGSRRAMAQALANAGLTPSAIDLVSAHATGTSANDVTESAAIGHLLGSHAPPVLALKAALGHLLGAAGLAEAILTLAAMAAGRAPAIVGLDEPDPACAINAVRGQAQVGTFQGALTNSAGIGGNNASLVLYRPAPGSAAPASTLPTPRAGGLVVRGLGWVLPGLQGAGPALPEVQRDQLLAQRERLAEFSVKGLLSAVKGYLDPAGVYTLGAAALCRQAAPGPTGERVAVVSVSQYGAPSSAYAFFQQVLDKGPRLASPMIFPHGYANTAGNLVAIEFGLAGPHLVLNTAPDISIAWAWARATLRWQQADEVWLLAAEAPLPAALPDGWEVLGGALCYRLAWDPLATHDAPAPASAADNRRGVVYASLGKE